MGRGSKVSESLDFRTERIVRFAGHDRVAQWWNAVPLRPTIGAVLYLGDAQN
jgi:hypothetical protein